MSQLEMNFEGIEEQPVVQFTEQAYLEYAMYVILDRALPFVGDGLKPVQRRIIYAMSELGLKAAAKFKKSARTVGDVLGKYHPHGDSACYEAMVLMAQPFSYRHPLIHGQGNWGSMDDPKSFAAMRYTEAKLTAYADVLLGELGQGTVPWVANFDGTLQEPCRLPAQLPNILLNGTTGIAVGMATDIPAHNLNEVVQACVHLLEHPKASVAELCEKIKGPDLPTAAEVITPADELLALYEKGSGGFRMRAVYQREGSDVVITALPHQVSGAKVLEQIAAQMQAKKLPMVVDLRDESDHEHPTRLVIVLRSNRVAAEEVMGHLFASTDLERSYRVNLNVIGLNGKPQVMDLRTLLLEWLTFRQQTVQARLQFRLDKITQRLHILAGLLIAYLNLDEVIRIIREEDEPKPALMQSFSLSSEQAEAILELKLRHLAKLEETKLRAEADELSDEQHTLEKTLASNRRLKTLVRKELTALAARFGEPRRSPLVARAKAQLMRVEARGGNEAVTVILSAKGWIRASKGHDTDGATLSYKSGDSFLCQAQGRSEQAVVFLDSTGRSYAMSCADLPSARGQGAPITGHVTPPSGAVFRKVMMGEASSKWLLVSTTGYGFIVPFAELCGKNRKGKQTLKVSMPATLLGAYAITDVANEHLVLATQQGRVLIIPLAELPVMSKGKGARLVHLDKNTVSEGKDGLVDCLVLPQNKSLIVVAGRRKISLTSSGQAKYRGDPGRRGVRLPKGYSGIPRLELTDAKS